MDATFSLPGPWLALMESRDKGPEETAYRSGFWNRDTDTRVLIDSFVLHRELKRSDGNRMPTFIAGGQANTEYCRRSLVEMVRHWTHNRSGPDQVVVGSITLVFSPMLVQDGVDHDYGRYVLLSTKDRPVGFESATLKSSELSQAEATVRVRRRG